MSYHVMVDIETLGLGENAIVVSIGAVKFDPATRTTAGEFYVKLDPHDQERRGRILSASTVLWWMQQSEAARGELKEPQLVVNNGTALNNLKEFIGNAEGVWGFGATFDNVILRSLFNSYGLRCWHYRSDRCFRTLSRLSSPLLYPAREGTHHNALDDAKFQTQWLFNILEETKIELS